MALNLTKEFLNDLRDAEDAKFVRHVLNHTVGEDGCFRPDKDDHRYHGIDDVWIRYVSRGTTAYRVIYVRKGKDIFLYRAGRHAVEERVKPPSNLSTALQVKDAPTVTSRTGEPTIDTGFLLKTTEAPFISRYLMSMYHLRHKEIYIVSPYVEPDLLGRHHHFGKFLDRAVEEDTLVVIITTPHDEGALPLFKDLETRGINVFFLPRLHMKLYMFEIDLASRSRWQQEVVSRVIVGSSNLTRPGLGFDDDAPNVEVCYALPSPMFEEARTYVTRLTLLADDYKKYEFKIRSRRS